MRPLLTALTVAVLAALSLSGCAGDDDNAAESPAADSVVSSDAPVDSSSAEVGETATSGDPSGDAAEGEEAESADTGGVTSLEPVASQSVDVLDPVPLDQDVSFDGELTGRIVRTRGVTIEGQGVGEFSGPALAVTVEFTNETADPVDLSAAVVTAAYGDGREAPTSDGPPARSVPAQIRAGESVRGVYVFTIPPAERDQVEISVSYSAEGPIAVLSGDAR